MKTLTLLTSIFISLNAYSAGAPVDYEKYFKTREACFTEIDNKTGKVINSYNEKRCQERLSPCSTFKIPLAYISFEEKVFADIDTPIPWDHVKREREVLNRDQTPKSWITDSVVWVSQIVTRKVGNEKLKSYLKKLNYGNQDTSGGIDKFWLYSSLKVSAKEQTQFLKSVWTDKAVFSEATREKVQKILFVKKLADGSDVYGKTGSCCIDPGCKGRQLGWFVGVVVNDKQTHSFAVNMVDTPKTGYAGLVTKNLTFDILDAQSSHH